MEGGEEEEWMVLTLIGYILALYSMFCGEMVWRERGGEEKEI